MRPTIDNIPRSGIIRACMRDGANLEVSDVEEIIWGTTPFEKKISKLSKTKKISVSVLEKAYY